MIVRVRLLLVAVDGFLDATLAFDDESLIPTKQQPFPSFLVLQLLEDDDST